MIDAKHLERILTTALAEDVGTGDVTTLCTVPPGTRSRAAFFAKGHGVLCGAEVVKAVFAFVDPQITVDFPLSGRRRRANLATCLRRSRATRFPSSRGSARR